LLPSSFTRFTKRLTQTLCIKTHFSYFNSHLHTVTADQPISHFSMNILEKNSFSWARADMRWMFAVASLCTCLVTDQSARCILTLQCKKYLSDVFDEHSTKSYPEVYSDLSEPFSVTVFFAVVKCNLWKLRGKPGIETKTSNGLLEGGNEYETRTLKTFLSYVYYNLLVTLQTFSTRQNATAPKNASTLNTSWNFGQQLFIRATKTCF